MIAPTTRNETVIRVPMTAKRGNNWYVRYRDGSLTPKGKPRMIEVNGGPDKTMVAQWIARDKESHVLGVKAGTVKPNTVEIEDVKGHPHIEAQAALLGRSTLKQDIKGHPDI